MLNKVQNTRVLAFDFGASSGRAVLGKYDGTTLEYEVIHRFENNLVTFEGKLCWDFHSLMKEVYTAIDKAKEIDSIAFDTWGLDYGLLDKDGELISLPVSYRDSRTNGVLEKLEKLMPFEELYAKTGTQIMEINTLTQLLCDENLEKADKLLFMPDLFSYILCKNMVCEQTIFSTSQLCDPRTKALCEKVLDVFKIKKDLFPKIVSSATIIGEYKGAKVISVAGHDTQSAVVALPTNEDDIAFLSCGTWSLLGTELPRPILSKESYEMGFSSEIGANGKINYLTNITGLWLIQECRRQWKLNGNSYTYAQLEEMAKACTSKVSIINVDDPHFVSPNDMPKKIAEHCKKHGLYVPQTVGEYCLCIYKSLAEKYSKTLKKLSKITDKKFSALYIFGGGSQSDLLCSLTEKYSGLPVHKGQVEATALGNIITQLIALGIVKDVARGREIIAKL